jgi:nitroreductase
VTAKFDFLERLMQERRSERQFRSDEVAPDVIDRLLDVAACAPSASNRQPYRFMVVTRRETLDRMVAVVEAALKQQERPDLVRLDADLANYGKNFLVFGQAPVVVVVFFRAGLLGQLSTRQPLDEIVQVREALSSAAAAIMQLLLAAHAMGLGACWMTGPCLAERELLAVLKAPPGLRIAALVPMGYCAAQATAPHKRRAAQMRLPEPMEPGPVEFGMGEGNGEGGETTKP